jgi:hypothetical protein
LKIAATALGGGGRRRRTWGDGIGISASKPRAYFYEVSISVYEDGKRECVQCKGRTLAAMARR